MSSRNMEVFVVSSLTQFDWSSVEHQMERPVIAILASLTLIKLFQGGAQHVTSAMIEKNNPILASWYTYSAEKNHAADRNGGFKAIGDSLGAHPNGLCLARRAPSGKGKIVSAVDKAMNWPKIKAFWNQWIPKCPLAVVLAKKAFSDKELKDLGFNVQDLQKKISNPWSAENLDNDD